MAELRETALDYIVGGDHICYSTSDQKRINKILKQAEEYPNDVKIIAQNDDGSIYAHLPMSWFKPPSPPKKVSDKQREAAGERFRKYRNENA